MGREMTFQVSDVGSDDCINLLPLFVCLTVLGFMSYSEADTLQNENPAWSTMMSCVIMEKHFSHLACKSQPTIPQLL